jgi:uncharacterized RDD family membrane protein YckC
MADAETTGAPAVIFRRLAALLYDALPAVALAFIVSFAMLPLTGGEAILDSTQRFVGTLYHLLWPLAVFGYFGWSWTQSGQTLGLRAWRLRLETDAGGRIGWLAATRRYLLGMALFWLACVGAWYMGHAGSPLAAAAAAALLAPLVLNFAWIAFDRERRSLLDVVGRTRVRRTA